MKRFQKTITRILLVGIFLPFVGSAQTHRAYADELFQKADYYKAFFLYRNLYGTNLEENQFAQRCNQAMKLTKEFLDLRASKQYYDAKNKLRELLEINPDDFHAPILPQLSIEEASYWQRLALKQNSVIEVNLMLDKAISLYQQGQNDGLNYKEIDDAIKQCEASKMRSGLSESIAKSSSIPVSIPISIVDSTTTKITEIISLPKIEIAEKNLPTEIKVVKTDTRNFRPRKVIPRREVATIRK